jgi:phage terminase small subunit
MAALKNPLHEAFIRAVASRKYPTHAAAYSSVRPDASAETAKVKACIILNSPAAKERLAEITGECCSKGTIDERIAERTIEKIAERMSEKMVLTREWVIDKLIENANRAMQTTPAVDSSGRLTGEYKWDGSVANRSLELLGKECGMFVERTENRNVTYGVSEEPMTPEEWTAKYATPEKSKLN